MNKIERDYNYNKDVFTYINTFIIFSLSLIIFLLVFKYSNYGFDFTDEGYYLNWISNPFYYKASATQFGFIYHPLYLFVGEDLVLLRKTNFILTLFLTWILSFLFLKKILLNSKNIWFISLIFSFGLSINIFLSYEIATPSYDTLTLQGLIVIIIGAMIIDNLSIKKIIFSSFLIGLGGWITLMSKPTTAICVGILLFFYFSNLGKYYLLTIFSSIFFALILFIISALIIDGSITVFIRRILLGLEFRQILGARYSLFDIIRIDLPQINKINFLTTTFFFILTVFFLWLISNNNNFSSLISTIISVAVFFTITIFYFNFYNLNFLIGNFQKLQIFGIILGCIFSFLIFFRNSLNFNNFDWRNAILFSMLPLIYVIGSNSNYLMKGTQAGIFWIYLSILIIAHFVNTIRLNNTLSLMLVLFQLITTIHLANEYENPHRQQQPLRLNNTTSEIIKGKTNIFLSNDYARYISQAKSIVTKNGFKSDTPVIDLTGQSPGLIYSLDGKALGLAWISGGYSGSLLHAISAFNLLSCEQIASAWILDEINGNRKIPHELLLSFGLSLKDYKYIGVIDTHVRPSPWKSNIKESKKQIFYKPDNKKNIIKLCKKKGKR